MRVKKLGHSCLLIEEGEGKLVTDPGNFSTAQEKVLGVNVILISHEHADHCHIDSLKVLLKNNPNAEIFTNKAVGKLLEKEAIRYSILEHRHSKLVSGFLIEGCGEKHAEILPHLAPVTNTGFFINEKLYFPGDAFFNPKKEVEVLALPVCAPWLKISEAIDYAKEIDPRVVFPIHDGMLKVQGGAFHALPEKILKADGIDFVSLTNGKSITI